MLSYLVTTVFALWFLATLVYQFVQHPRVDKVKLYDFIGLVPHYRVFERPVKDLALLYRFSGETEWTQYPTKRTFRWWNLIFYPEVYRTKVLWQYLRPFSEYHAQGLALSSGSPPFQALVNLIDEQNPRGQFFRFMIKEADDMIFCSDFVKRNSG